MQVTSNSALGQRYLIILILSCLASLFLTGCSAQSVTVPEDAANWKGAPMPKDFKPQVGAPGGSQPVAP